MTKNNKTETTSIIAITFFVGMMAIVPTSASADIDDNLVAYFGFDGNTLDYSGNQNNGTVTGSEQYRSGPMGTAFNVDGASYITLDNESNFDFERTDVWSTSFWINTVDTTNFKVPISKHGVPGSTVGWAIYIHSSDQKITFAMWEAVAGSTLRSASTNTVTDGKWHHVVTTYDGSETTAGVNIYIDNMLETPTNTANTLAGSILNDWGLTIGARADVGANKYDGLIDDVRIYDVVLNSTQVQSLYEENPFVNIEKNKSAIESNDVEIDDLYDFWDDLRENIITWLAGRP